MGKTTIPSNTYTRLFTHTFTNTTEQINITSYIQNYSELLIYIRPAASLRWQPPQVIPIDLLKTTQSFTMYFEGGAYATAQGNTGYRFTISYDGTNWYISGNWMYWEGNISNTFIVVYGH